MTRKCYKLEYDGNKRLNSGSVHLCDECHKKIRSSVNTERANLFRSVSCWGCSKTIRKSSEGESTPDFASGVIILLEQLNADGVINRLTRASDVQEKADGAVKISRSITQEHDAVSVHCYTNDTSIENKDDVKNYIETNKSSLETAIQYFEQLPNFNVEYTFQESEDGFTDIFTYVYHRNIPSPT